MNNRGNYGQHMSRRVALSGAAFALGAAAIASAISQAAAQQKIGQADAKYQGNAEG
jgi:F0F1-type ATP synthase membrane subunit c/vacuolar-type H+-ATPase subunit K